MLHSRADERKMLSNNDAPVRVSTGREEKLLDRKAIGEP